LDVAAFLEEQEDLRASGVNWGRETLRSTVGVRIFGVPPSTDTSAMMFIAYQMSFESPPSWTRCTRPRRVGTDGRIADALQLEDVVGGERPPRLCGERQRHRDRDQEGDR
jgi:hypothetical protein